VAVGALTSAEAQIQAYTKCARVIGRNFYGGVKVFDENVPGVGARRMLTHGLVLHGSQFLAPERRSQPTSYYAPGSGVQLAIGALHSPSRVGVIGLGAGTLAAYGRKGDYYRFYEINPLMIEFAQREFTYLRDSDAKVDLVLGDGRSSLEREADQNYDLLVVDAFSGDSIPVHLLSLESFQLYFRHLKSDGILALHISNESLDLEPVIQKAATHGNYNALLFENPGNPGSGQSQAFWALLTRGDWPSVLSAEKGRRSLRARDHLQPWTDSHSNLLQILK
jgi:SAM-dependent methyltransferase